MENYLPVLRRDIVDGFYKPSGTTILYWVNLMVVYSKKLRRYNMPPFTEITCPVM